jgi:hypothetical protein
MLVLIQPSIYTPSLQYLFIYLFFHSYGSFKDSGNSSDYVVPNDGVISKLKWLWKEPVVAFTWGQ